MFKKFKLYKIYKKFIKDNEVILEQKYKLRRDYTNYLYTIVNLDPDMVNKYYGENDKVATPVINAYIKSVDEYFSSQNMSEFIAIRKISRVDDFNRKIEFGFSLFDSKKRANYTIVAGLVVVLSIISYFLFF